MRFYIYRASDFSSKKKPCKSAVLRAQSQIYWDVRSFYTVDINSVEDIIALKNEVGEGLIIDVVDRCMTGENLPDIKYEIMIYDGYIE